MWEERWRTGDHILLRDVVRGRVRSAIPVTVVEHVPQRIVLFVCAGTTFMLPADWDRKESRDFFADPGHVEATYVPPGQLMIMERAARHSILVRWTPEWEFLGWYVNLQTPAKRSPFGIDITDQVLDVVISPDGRTYQWKDEDELARGVTEGFVTAGEAVAIRAEGERVVDLAMRCQAPFNEPWPEWRPDCAWTVPPLPVAWATVP